MKNIQIAKWANLEKNGLLSVESGVRPIQMKHSDGTGFPLLKDGAFGADIIRFEAGKGVANHTHMGAHILFVIKGTGFVDYEDVPQPLEPGLCYFVPSNVKHAIRATTELVLIAVGNDHQVLDSEKRLDVVK